MSAEPLDRLLGRLGRGDPEAARELVAAYEPYLRMLVRRHCPSRLRAKFDSTDVVQSVWVHVLHGLGRAAWQFPDRAALKALLITITRRRLVSRYRHHHTALDHEEPGETDLERLAAPGQARPSEFAQAEELWRRMLALCPPAHHEVLWLRRQGFTLQEIAAHTGLHEGSVRRILRRLARQLACQEEPPLAATSGEC